MSSVMSGLRCHLYRIKGQNYRAASQTLFENCERFAHSLFVPNLNGSELHGSVIVKRGHDISHSDLRKNRAVPSVGPNGSHFEHFKQVFENIISCPWKLNRSLNLSTRQKLCDSASKLQCFTRGQGKTGQGLSHQRTLQGIQLQCGMPTRSGLLVHSGPEWFLCRHISTSTIDQKKKASLKGMDAAKDADYKGDKSRKSIRKKVQPVIRQVEGQATVYAVGDNLDFESFKEHLAEEQLYELSQVPEDLLDKVIYVTSRYQPENYPKKDIFFFREGSAVFWNVPEGERLKVLKDMMKHCERLIDMKLIMDESDSLEIQPTKLETFLNNDIININEDEEAADLMLVKYACSNALSQSVKLSIWETELYRQSQKCEHISQTLRKGGKVSMSKQKILKTLGTIFAIRQFMNLGSELLDTPDFYWDRDNLEDLYKQCYNYLCVPHRIKVMNEKISYCLEVLELVKDQESDNRHIRLERIIIFLIAFEVVLELKKEFEKSE
ncbi:required for meiotic nuclear division protein 1 homolog [Mizuhopecten yessoensis]|uniref:Required for meiotic nuclear division protein 1-like n=1 Tax=Mizuhopecten yessoensis TaxID=6573 RepID=A0A210Q1F2_MIZYE|nr:required for meiotic nuclear division protein 1 homolog [Mizuhopecten yessoensis]OWF42535.1 Required for meiotic nuclear division protein 1-like [Mizuhopecten yessoensis]